MPQNMVRERIRIHYEIANPMRETNGQEKAIERGGEETDLHSDWKMQSAKTNKYDR